ncbi:hypothetical protein [Leptospira gomenensis]|nr:hypothetical protein [Leptospira gomenensis]
MFRLILGIVNVFSFATIRSSESAHQSYVVKVTKSEILDVFRRIL